jgi:hypothetical protein
MAKKSEISLSREVLADSSQLGDISQYNLLRVEKFHHSTSSSWLYYNTFYTRMWYMVLSSPPLVEHPIRGVYET